MDNNNILIASRVAELRRISGKTSDEMASMLGMETELYLKCESGETDFTFAMLHKCADIFDIDINDLLTGEQPKLSRYSVLRKGEGAMLNRTEGFSYQLLATNFKGKFSEPFLVQAKFDPAEMNKPIPVSTHKGEEFDYILKGKLKVVIGDSEEVLSEGDTLYYDSSIPHGMIAWDADCTFLAVVMDNETGHDNVSRGGHYHFAHRRNDADSIFRRFADLVEDEKGKLIDISFHYPDNYNFAYDVVDALAKKCPDKLAMLHLDENKTERRFSFGDMARESSRTANYFASLGIKKGDRVMLILKRHYQFWYSILALHKLGAIVIPATDQLVKKDLVYRFQAASVSALVCTSQGDVSHQVELAMEEYNGIETKIMVGSPREGWYHFNTEYANHSDFIRRVDNKFDEVSLMYFTSGTTGYPKIAAHSYTYSLGHLITAKSWHNVNPDGIHFTISDTGWGKALWGKIYGQWLCEAAIFTYDFHKFDAKDILPLFSKYGITTFCAPPTMYRFFIKEDLSSYDLSSLEYASTAGEALNPEVYQQFLLATGIKLMEGFGQTETTLTICNLLGEDMKPGSMGKPSPMYHMDLLNSGGVSCKVGEVGEIVVRATPDNKPCGLFSGYYRNQEATDKAWHDGYYHTGDTAWRDEDGYFWFVGRVDDLIKSSGYRIGPFEIESVLMELPYVLECAVTGVPDPVRGQVVKATIVLTKGTVGSDDLIKEIKEYVKTHTAPYKYPRIVEFTDELPKTISGKIRRVDIREKDNM